VAAILRLGSTLGLETVAEGIGEQSLRDRLRALKCRFGQGHFFSRPVAADQPAPSFCASVSRAPVPFGCDAA